MSERFRVMVVDGDERSREKIRRILDSQYDLIILANGESALERLDSHEPDIFLVEAKLPGMSGAEFCKAVKGTIRFSAAPVIFISENLPRPEIMECYKAGATFFIPKPFKNEILLRNIGLQIPEGAIPASKKMDMEQLQKLETLDRDAKDLGEPASDEAEQAEREESERVIPEQKAEERNLENPQGLDEEEKRRAEIKSTELKKEAEEERLEMERVAQSKALQEQIEKLTHPEKAEEEEDLTAGLAESHPPHRVAPKPKFSGPSPMPAHPVAPPPLVLSSSRPQGFSRANKIFWLVVVLLSLAIASFKFVPRWLSKPEQAETPAPPMSVSEWGKILSAEGFKRLSDEAAGEKRIAIYSSDAEALVIRAVIVANAGSDWVGDVRFIARGPAENAALSKETAAPRLLEIIQRFFPRSSHTLADAGRWLSQSLLESAVEVGGADSVKSMSYFLPPQWTLRCTHYMNLAPDNPENPLLMIEIFPEKTPRP